MDQVADPVTFEEPDFTAVDNDFETDFAPVDDDLDTAVDDTSSTTDDDLGLG